MKEPIIDCKDCHNVLKNTDANTSAPQKGDGDNNTDHNVPENNELTHVKQKPLPLKADTKITQRQNIQHGNTCSQAVPPTQHRKTQTQADQCYIYTHTYTENCKASGCQT